MDWFHLAAWTTGAFLCCRIYYCQLCPLSIASHHSNFTFFHPLWFSLKEQKLWSWISRQSKHVLWGSIPPFMLCVSNSSSLVEPTSFLPAGALITPSTLFPLSVELPFFVYISFLSVLCLSFFQPFCSFLLLSIWHDLLWWCHSLAFSIPRTPETWGCLNWVGQQHFDKVCTAGLHWNQDNGWIQGWVGLI